MLVSNKIVLYPSQGVLLRFKAICSQHKTVSETTGFESDIKLYQKQVICFLLQICFVVNCTPVLVPYY